PQAQARAVPDPSRPRHDGPNSARPLLLLAVRSRAPGRSFLDVTVLPTTQRPVTPACQRERGRQDCGALGGRGMFAATGRAGLSLSPQAWPDDLPVRGAPHAPAA